MATGAPAGFEPLTREQALAIVSGSNNALNANPSPVGFEPIPPGGEENLTDYSGGSILSNGGTHSTDTLRPETRVRPRGYYTQMILGGLAPGQIFISPDPPSQPQRRGPVLEGPEFRRQLAERFNARNSSGTPTYTQDQISEFASQNNQFLPNIEDVIKMRDENPDIRIDAERNGVVELNGRDATRARLHRQHVIDVMERWGLRPDSGWLDRFVVGALRAPERLTEGLAQLGIRGSAATGIVDQVSADRGFRRIADRARVQDEARVRGTAGALGEFAGEAAITGAVPLGRVMVGGRLAPVLTGARRVAVGAGLGAAQPVDTPEEQNTNTVVSALLMPAMIPAGERVLGALGGSVADRYMRIANQGVGNRLFNAVGTLTPYGRALKVRLTHATPGVDESFIDETLQAIVRANPRRLPADEHVVADALATDRQVPLTGGMRRQDASDIQRFEQAQAGGYGKPMQDRAIAADRAIDDSVRSNIRDIDRTGQNADEAATSAATALTEAEQTGAANRDHLYNQLRQSNERIVDLSGIRGIRTAFIKANGGQAAADTLPPSILHYLTRIKNLVATGAQRRGGANVRFGELWSLNREISEAARSAQGAEAVPLRALARQFRDYFDNVPPSAFESGENGVARQLGQANAANRQFMDTFAARSGKSRSGRRMQDKPGETIENIVTHVRQTSERGEDINPGTVTNMIFGSAQNLTSAGATQAVNRINRIVAAVPATRDAIKALTVHRVLNQVEQGLFSGTGGLKIDTLQNRVREVVDHNIQVLQAAGWTQRDITTLRVNTYLAALKTLPAGARNPSGSGKWARIALGTAFRRSIAQISGGLVTGGVATGGIGAGPAAIGAAMAGTIWAASKFAENRLARRALSSTVRSRGPTATRRGTDRAAQIGLSALSRARPGAKDEEE